MTEQTTTSIFSEAPASWNTRYNSPDGFTCQLTLRAETGTELLARVQSAINWLQENGCTPIGNGSPAHMNSHKQETSTLSDGSPNPAWCDMHNVAMKKREKDGQVWFSHKASDGSWCRGKPNNGK